MIYVYINVYIYIYIHHDLRYTEFSELKVFPWHQLSSENASPKIPAALHQRYRRPVRNETTLKSKTDVDRPGTAGPPW